MDAYQRMLVRLIHQNKGRLSNTKRKLFQELSDAEVERIESAILAAAGEAAG
jgi:hypothetical protein